MDPQTAVIVLDGDAIFAGSVQAVMDRTWISPTDSRIDAVSLADQWQQWANP